MKKISLTKGQFALVDDKDFGRVSVYNWSAYKKAGEKTWYARRTVRVGRKSLVILMHRFILEMGMDDKRQVDHKDRNGLNNQRDNIRPCTHGQNQCNSDIRADNTSGHRGLTWIEKYRWWQVYIGVGGKYKYLGVYKDKKDAALAYNKAALEYHGEFATLNDVEVKKP